jgi:hypothetical protein
MSRALPCPRVFGLALAAEVLLGACTGRTPGRILHDPQNPALVRAPDTWSLAVEVPRDERPPPERLGSEAKTTAFLFLLFSIHLSERRCARTASHRAGRATGSFPAASPRASSFSGSATWPWPGRWRGSSISGA